MLRLGWIWLFLGIVPLFAAEPDAAPSVTELAKSLREISLDPSECYRVRDLSFSKEDVRVFFNEGYLIFSKPVLGRRLVAVFSPEVEGGDGEVILIPPTRSERQSLASFTKSPNLDEHLRAALLISTDGTSEALYDRVKENPAKKVPEIGAILAGQWSPAAGNISTALQMRLTQDLLSTRSSNMGLLFLAVSGTTLGNFDLLADSMNGRIAAQQSTERAGRPVFDVWANFPSRSARTGKQPKPEPFFTVPAYQIEASLDTDMRMKVVTRARFKIGKSPARVFPFQISRNMHISAVKIDGAPAELLLGESARGRITTGSEEEVFVVSVPQPLAPDSEHQIEFQHEGNVIATAGEGVYFVSSRSSWYPHIGSGLATYDLTFRYPKRLTLATAGELIEDRTVGDERITHRRSDMALGAAGFNLGDYEKVSTTAAGITLEVFGNRHLAAALRPTAPEPPPPSPFIRRRGFTPAGDGAQGALPAPPDPLARLQAVAADISSALDFFTGLFGPPPLKTLVVTPIPGAFGQGFPGLIYLSTFAYLDPRERPAALRDARLQMFFSDLIAPHEAAHQWWGSAVSVERQEDDWLVEALANYSALLWIEKKKGPHALDSVLAGYREELLFPDASGKTRESAGPVTWGLRLETAGNPEAWRAITYGKGAWILHMLRRRLGDEQFFKMLAAIRTRYAFRSFTTEDVRMLAREFRPKGLSSEATDALFDNWVYGTGIPDLQLHYSVSGVAPALKLSGTLTQSGVDEDFSVDVPIQVQFAKGPPETIWVRSSTGQEPFSAKLSQKPVRVEIAEDVLKKK